MPKRSKLILMLFWLALSGVFNPVHAESTLPKGLLALDGRDAPGLTLKNMDGHAFNLNDAKGEWVLVHFWASWCGPCRKELPTIESLVKQLGEKPVRVVLVNTAEDDDTVFAFLPTVAPDLDTYMDRDGSVTEAWQPRGLPSTFFISPDGKLRYLALGGRTWDSPPYLPFVKNLPSQK